MKKIIFLFCFLISLRCFGQDSFSVSSWRYMENRTLVKIELDFGKWLVFMVPGEHINDLDFVFSHGCVLNKRSGEMAFPITDKKYVTRKDEGEILEALKLKTLCNK